MYAVIETGGKQYKVSEGDVIYVEKLEAAENDSISFDKVLAVREEGALNFGAPYVDCAKVSGKVIKNGKSKKVIVFKYKPKKGYRRKQGHRQPYTKVQIISVKG